MRNATQPGVVVPMIADRDYKTGDLTAINSAVGVVAVNTKQGQELELALEQAYRVKSDPGLQAEPGVQVDIDIANMQVVEAGTGDGTIGMVIWQPANTEPGFTHVRLDGVSLTRAAAPPAGP